jgi:hypothetical protein
MNNLSSLPEHTAAYTLSISEEPVEFEHESTLVLAGTFTNDNGQVCEVGDLLVAAANTSHQPNTSPGCLILCITGSNPYHGIK